MIKKLYDVETEIREKKYIKTLKSCRSYLDEWLKEYNEERTHSGKHCFGKTPMETFKLSRHIADEKDISKMQNLTTN